ncbi:hypothetical protein TNCV_2238581 [Trichonephila clavipes]|nr:hypothetical protein TNCV_2238581 [Trichonephila clavipes]
MPSFLVLREGDTRNRWRDGQVYPDAGQGTMAPWARRPGRKERRRKKEEKRREREGPGLGWRKREKSCPGWRRHERRALVGTDGKRALEKKGLVRDWSGKTMNAGGVANRI